jgi:hypothetical protein
MVYARMNLFKTLDLETISTCNRICPTCIRNSHPDKEAVKSFFSPTYLPMWVIDEAFDQCHAIGFTGSIILSHYNEPLLDERLPWIVKLAKTYPFESVFLNTNGDLLTEELAQELDGHLDRIIVSLYMREPVKSMRADWISSLFKKTKVDAITQSDHIPTHFSPKFDVEALAKKHIANVCHEPEMRVIINHRRQFLLCCDDVVGNFDLGTFPEMGIEEFWFGEKRGTIMRDLQNMGGRLKHLYCSTCPRP